MHQRYVQVFYVMRFLLHRDFVQLRHAILLSYVTLYSNRDIFQENLLMSTW